MAPNRKPTTILDSLGEEIIRIVAPVSTCMFLVVFLVTILNTDSSSDSSPNFTTIASIVYNESSSDSIWDKLKGALLNSLVFVAVITVVSFILVLLFYLRCTKFLKFYMGFSAFVVLGFMGGEVALFLIRVFSFPIDCVTFVVILFNFTVVGVLAVFMPKMPILITQGYMVVIGMLVAYWFTMLPEWTTWALLVALALYDLAAVLLPGGPLRLLVELAMSRDEEIPALVYEARPVNYHEIDPRAANVARTLWKGRSSGSGSSSVENLSANSNSNLISDLNPSPEVGSSRSGEERETRVVVAREDQNSEVLPELLAPLVNRELEGSGTRVDGGREDNASMDGWAVEGIGLGSSGAIKLGLGDFIFYSVLVGRAAMYDFMTVYACYLAIIGGLGITLMLLAFYRKALPALPMSILLALPTDSRFFQGCWPLGSLTLMICSRSICQILNFNVRQLVCSMASCLDSFWTILYCCCLDLAFRSCSIDCSFFLGTHFRFQF